MSTFISLLRGINVGGARKLPMETLRQFYVKAGYANVRTYVQSGNVVFDFPADEPGILAARIEQQVERECGYSVKVFIRTPSQFQFILEHNPFLADQAMDTSKLHVAFLYQQPDQAAWSKLTPPAGIPDQFQRGETVIYTYHPNGYGRSKLAAAFFERHLGVAITDRNWNTVNALCEMAQ